MTFKSFTAGSNDDNRRIDKVIRAFAKNLSLSQIYKALRKGLIKVNGKKVNQDTKIFENDEILIADFLLEDSVSETEKNKADFDISSLPPLVFQNENILIFNKPRGLKVHGPDSLALLVEQFYNSSEHENSLSFKPGPLHRIDRYTTGLIAFSWSIQGARIFSEYIKNHDITKKYHAILQGHLAKQEQWEDLIEKEDSSANKVFHTVEVKTEQVTGNEKSALTTVKPLAYGKYKNTELTYAEITIFTGRQHQIRAQSAFHGYPLFGDSAYNKNGFKNGNFTQFFLHAYNLSIPKDNPLGLPDTVIAPLPKDFSDFLTEYFCITN